MLDKVMKILAILLMVAEGSALVFLFTAWRRDRREYSGK